MKKSPIEIGTLCANCTQCSSYREAYCCIESKTKRFIDGGHILSGGSNAKQLVLITRGKLKIEFVLDSGIHIPYSASPVKYMTEPPIFGVIAVFSDENFLPLDVIADGDCEAIVINKEEVENMMMHCRLFLRNYLSWITSRMSSTMRNLAILTYKDLKAKLAFYLLSIAQDSKFKLDCTVTDLAILLHADRSSVSRMIALFVKEGLITYSQGEGSIINANALKNKIE